MLTPHDWQENMRQRASFVESKLAHGLPVLMVSLDSGILAFTMRRETPKIYEIYDRLIYGAIGQQSDIENLRISSLEFTHKEGYERSEEDVTIKRVVAAMSEPLKKNFNDYQVAPLVVRSIFAEVAEAPEKDIYYLMNYDGDYKLTTQSIAIAGTPNEEQSTKNQLAEIAGQKMSDSTIKKCGSIYDDLVKEMDIDSAKLIPEIILMERNPVSEKRFKVLSS